MESQRAIAVGIFLACCANAVALNPSLDISQYAHTWSGAETSCEIGLSIPGSIAYLASPDPRGSRLFRKKADDSDPDRGARS
jgi:hypothetical protein